MTEHKTSEPTPDGHRVSIDNNVIEKMEELTYCCRRLLTCSKNIQEVNYPKRSELVFRPNRQKKIVSGDLESKGPVWDPETCNKILQHNDALFNSLEGNLYALHIRHDSSRDWKFKYVGVCNDAKVRLCQHLVHAGSKTSSKLWNVARAIDADFKVGFSLAAVSGNQASSTIGKALAGYVENRIIEWLKEKARKESGAIHGTGGVTELAVPKGVTLQWKPTTALDVTVQAQILELIDELAARPRHGGDSDHA